jgi:glycosyltransferase involved in cell wall biosynthesis
MPLKSEDILFVGRGATTISWYRCGAPAYALGSDWIGCGGDDPNNLHLITSLKRGGMTMPKLDDYKVVVLQQVKGQLWFNEIRRLKDKKVKVLYEIDDYIHGVSKLKHHEFKGAYDKKSIASHELCMRAADGLIVSTEWLAKRYAKFNKNIFICENAVEFNRYKLEIPPRDVINIGWAGSAGHLEAVMKWVPAVRAILDEYQDARFISVGLNVGQAKALLETGRSMCLPVCSIENFPGALTNFDIAIGPALQNNFYAGKSDLRMLEAGALGIPLVGDPFVYKNIVHRETGMVATNCAEAYEGIKQLIEEEELYEEVCWNVMDYVKSQRSMEDKGANQWERTFVQVAGQSV